MAIQPPSQTSVERDSSPTPSKTERVGHTPGPWTIEESSNRISIVGPFGFHINRYAYSTAATTIEGVMNGVGMGNAKAEARRENARQMADIRLAAASPTMLDALYDAVIALRAVRDGKEVVLSHDPNGIVAGIEAAIALATKTD